ncbi:hypothetical protein [Merismopedia glauca]|uniref:Uncharacterized protein n=1 Tax=Merismopedia glauca CCAP 1448/3 TaxID=1296344 RepID=A0A2T1C9J2_9CYAN|nr:hypothetical protein [Merismopedia glauca]PSB04930.1 hypothetical protein C7B64_01500 [Merismopedia glauca CCAP 1448/3]
MSYPHTPHPTPHTLITKVRKFINSRAPDWLSQEIHLFARPKTLNNLVISPPLKTSPRTPHYRRINIVYQALDNAQSEGIVKYTDLIEYVKNETGIGCSRKLIAKWKRKQEG